MQLTGAPDDKGAIFMTETDAAAPGAKIPGLERGMDTAALGVDTDNPSGRLGLYESYSLMLAERGAAWRKPLEVRS